VIVGVGIDIIEVGRVGRALSNPRFVDRVYTKAEQELLQARRMNAQTAAGSFAAKEAAAKALGTGFGTIHWTEIEVLRTAEGRPHLVLYGGALGRFHALGGRTLWVSISHTAQYAAAQVIMEGE
jgi:holo-[acyl-carrier protein] synthase